MALLEELLTLRARTPTTLILVGMVLELRSKMLVWFSLSVSLLKGEERLRLWAWDLKPGELVIIPWFELSIRESHATILPIYIVLYVLKGSCIF